jgi:hypothetical protein
MLGSALRYLQHHLGRGVRALKRDPANDSCHTERNVRIGLDRAWPTLRPGGALRVDDIDFN